MSLPTFHDVPDALAFVTVGTTNFDDLVAAIDSPEVVSAFGDIGIKRLRIQIGRGQYEPTVYIPAHKLVVRNDTFDGKCETQPEIRNSNLSKQHQFQSQATVLKVDYYRYRQNYAFDVRDASLVISHAGAGSIMDALKLHKPLIVVVNDKLMDNHQEELAATLMGYDYLVATNCKNLSQAIQSFDRRKLQKYPKVDLEAFPKLVDDEMKEKVD